MVKTSSLRLIGAAAVFASLALGNDDIPDPESDVPVDDAVEEPAAAADEDDAAPASPEIACEDYGEHTNLSTPCSAPPLCPVLQRLTPFPSLRRQSSRTHR